MVNGGEDVILIVIAMCHAFVVLPGNNILEYKAQHNTIVEVIFVRKILT